MTFALAVSLGLSTLLADFSAPVAPAGPQSLWQARAYDCSNKTCKQISSCEEACYKLMVCGHRKRDADNDGIPCENLCSQRCE
ncbi:MAG: excalibur calcium-binding domain-containing protein [Paracoccaceae bacterium]